MEDTPKDISHQNKTQKTTTQEESVATKSTISQNSHLFSI